jgi:hypothetical protein
VDGGLQSEISRTANSSREELRSRAEAKWRRRFALRAGEAKLSGTLPHFRRAWHLRIIGSSPANLLVDYATLTADERRLRNSCLPPESTPKVTDS